MRIKHFKYRLLAAVLVMTLVVAAGCGKTEKEESEGSVATETETSVETQPEPGSSETKTYETQPETGSSETETVETETDTETDETETETETEHSSETGTEKPSETETPEAELGIKDGVLTFVDAHDNIHQVEVNEDWPANDYDPSAFVMQAFTTPKDMRMIYDSDEYDYRLGIDVYGEHGGIDFWAVDYVGYDFVIVRGGYRGYLYPSLVLDERVLEYVGGALEYGLDVGVYFFSQAISEEEAEEEARFMIDALEEEGFGPDDLTMGIIYDPESILNEEARTDDLTREQITANAIAFCETVKEAGYKPMIYANMLWEAEKLDLKELSEYPFWYADYTEYPQTPYAFEIWQYGHGMAGGVAAQVDLDIQLIPKNDRE